MQLISILSMMFASLAYLIPSLFIFVAVCLSLFLYFDVIAFCKRFKCSSKVRRYIFDVLSAAVNVLFDDCLEFYYLLYYLCFTNFVKSSSNQTTVLLAVEILCAVGSVWFVTFIKNMAFHLNFLIKSSTFCISCNYFHRV